MKKNRLLLPLLLLLFASGIKAQAWFDVGTHWYYTEFEPSLITTYKYFSVRSDTVINGQPCKMVNGFPFAIYEQAGAVYVRHPSGSWIQCYDINGIVGQSFPIFRSDSPQETVTLSVTGTGTMVANGHTLKVLNVDVTYNGNTFQDQIVERMGMRAFFFPKQTQLTNPQVRGLRCFQDNVVGNYSFNIASSCTYQGPSTVGLPETPNEPEAIIIISPDNIQIATDNAGQLTASLFDISGKNVALQTFTGATVISLNDLAKGIYVLNVTDENGKKSVRKVIRY